MPSVTFSPGPSSQDKSSSRHRNMGRDSAGNRIRTDVQTQRLANTHLSPGSPSNGSDSSSRSSSSSSSPRSRRPSNPMAPPFIVSAPGKTIVYGEHAVVHGRPAMAAAISLRSYLLCTTLSRSKRTVTMRFADIGLDHTWNLPDLPWAAFSDPSKKKRYYDLVTCLDDELVETLQPHIVDITPDGNTETRKLHQAAAISFLYLLLSLGSEHSPPCIYTLRSTIPIGAGLGSSASVCVCIATALLLQARALSGPHRDQQSEEASEQLERINRWAFVGEVLIHGNPSGVDNTVATNGRAVLFQRKDYNKPPDVAILRDFPELPLLLIDTCTPKSTATEVAKVGQLKKNYPIIAENIFNSIESIVRSAHDLVTDASFDPANPAGIQQLGELMEINHGLLASLGVSHHTLERLRYLVNKSEIGWTKLTGAGGGGCAITLLKPESLPEQNEDHTNGNMTNGTHSNGDSMSIKSSAVKLKQLEQDLKDEGFIKYTTTLGGDGVGVLYPAVIDDEEIDQETFITAEGRNGVEQLVSGKTDRDGWKYWRP